MPGPRDSFALSDVFFLNIRGLYVPEPTATPAFWAFALALLLALGGAWELARRARSLKISTGQEFPVFFSSLALLVILPGLSILVFGKPFTWTLPELRGFNFVGGMVIIPELFAITLALTIYTAAFIAETVRSGIQSVSHGQTEAARSLGLRPKHMLRLVIIPQAMRVIIPPLTSQPLTSQYLNLVKNSSLAAAIGYPDLVSLFAGTVLNQTGQAIETIAITMSVYLAISLTISFLMNIYNKRIALIER